VRYVDGEEVGTKDEAPVQIQWQWL
jgi:hypothetical protein